MKGLMTTMSISLDLSLLKSFTMLIISSLLVSSKNIDNVSDFGKYAEKSDA